MTATQKTVELAQDWHPHPDDDGIAFTDNPVTFVELCKITSGESNLRAVILQRSDEEKQKTRDEIQAFRKNKGSILQFGHPEKKIIKDKGSFFYEPPREAGIFPQKMNKETIPETLKTLFTMLNEITGKSSMTASLMDKWRVERGDNHDHEHVVLNVVTSQENTVNGTVLPLKNGNTFQVDEGDYLLMAAKCKHSTEIVTESNKEKDRTTIATHPMNDTIWETMGSSGPIRT